MPTPQANPQTPAVRTAPDTVLRARRRLVDAIAALFALDDDARAGRTLPDARARFGLEVECRCAQLRYDHAVKHIHA